MRFLFDECCHRLLVVALREAGHDVRYAAETDARATDLIISILAAEENRIVVTADYDFGELAIRRQQALPGVILLAPSQTPIADRAARLLDVISKAQTGLLGALTIIEDGRVRQRPIE